VIDFAAVVCSWGRSYALSNGYAHLLLDQWLSHCGHEQLNSVIAVLIARQPR
jgi:hypothetical protein